ncbi:MAG: hypothetical protein Q9162_004331 [Coniocarpon cinnabarinum]
MSQDGFKVPTMSAKKNRKGLRLDPNQSRAAPPSDGDAQVPGSFHNTEDRPDTLEIGVEFHLDWNNEDLIVLKELGSGNGGTVSKVQHVATRRIMARKIIHVEAKEKVRKAIVQELQIMHHCKSPNIVDFYGAFMNHTGDVVMCMEYMDVGSLDSISKNFGPVRVDVLGKIAEAILGGLTYLYVSHRIMHRDIKPSNVLVNSGGYIKLCDFGVSSELQDSIADTFVGTGTYMAPERIQGGKYTVKSDVWSVGLTLMELAIAKFPFAPDSEAIGHEDEAAGPQGILDLLQQIVLEPSPRLPPSDAFPQILEDMISKCLMKDPKQRPTPQQLYESDEFLLAAKRTPVDLQAWAVSMMERHNRKSHLLPDFQLPADVNRVSNGGSNGQHLTPNDIPIGTLSLENTNGESAHGRPPFPTRTSSATRVPQAGPPPTGPLPQVPR